MYILNIAKTKKKSMKSETLILKNVIKNVINSFSNESSCYSMKRIKIIFCCCQTN